MNRRLSFPILAIVIMLSFVGCTSNKENEKISDLSDLNNSEITVITSRYSACSVASQEAFPNASQVYDDYEQDCIEAVLLGTADAFVVEKPIIDKELLTDSTYSDSLRILSETIDSVNIAVGLQKDDTELELEFNQFIAFLKEQGTLEEMKAGWCIGETDTLPDIPKPENPKEHIVVGTCGYLQPWSYVNSAGELVGFDIEFIMRFACYANLEVEIVTMNFAELVEALQNKTIDAVVSNLHITDERRDIISYSVPYDVNDIVACVRSDRIQNSEKKITQLSDLNSRQMSIIAETGSACALVAGEQFPNAELVYGTFTADCFFSILERKTDGFVIEKKTYEKAVKVNPSLAKNLTTFGGTIGNIDIAVGLPKGNPKLKGLFDRFILDLKKDGTLDDMYQRWLINDEKEMPPIPRPEAPTLKLKIGTCGFVEPWSYVCDNGELNGFDIELIHRFAKFANADIDIQVMGFDALVASLESGRLDAVVSDLNITEERRKIIDYSEPYYVSSIVVCVHRNLLDFSLEDIKAMASENLNGRSIGILKHSPYVKACRDILTDSTINMVDNVDELLQRLTEYDVDAVALSEPLVSVFTNDNPNAIVLDNDLYKADTVFIIGRGKNDLKEKIDSQISKYREDGTLDELYDKWINSTDYSEKTIEIPSDYEATAGILNVHVKTGIQGVSFVDESGNLLGYDVELIRLIAKDLGYNCLFAELDDDAVFGSIKLKQADIGIGDIILTDELKKDFIYTVPIREEACKLLMLGSGDSNENMSFSEKIRDGFRNTFIAENRWKMIIGGILTTLKITVLSTIFGTAVGVLFGFALQSKIKCIRMVGNTLSSLLNATPLVVILMVLYYIVFSNDAVTPIYVAIIGFTIDFGNTVAGLLSAGIKSIGMGQVEAAITLGYKRRTIYTDILLPQASMRMFNMYRAAIINLLKNTAIVGYITIEDLTRVSDIIRSRTYDAFFPLISTALIYVLLSAGLIFVLNLINKNLEPKNRKMPKHVCMVGTASVPPTVE